MSQNKPTLFGELRKGDRFYFVGDAQKQVYQLTKENLMHRQAYNRIDIAGNKEWQFDKQSANNRQVIFLRNAETILP